MAVVAYRSAAGNNNATGGTTIVATKPTGAADDDVLICAITARGGTGTTITPPSTWTGATATIFNAGTSGTKIIQGLCFGAGIFVAHCLGRDGVTVIGTSTDGITWSAQTSPFTGTSIVSGGRGWYGNGIFMLTAIGFTQTSEPAATSPDGITWTLVSGLHTAGCIIAQDVTYDEGHGVWVVVGENSTGTINQRENCAYLSYDNGASWTKVDIRPGVNGGHVLSVVYDKTRGRLVSGTDAGTTAYSDDGGLTWTTATITASLDVMSLAVNPAGFYVAVGLATTSGLYTSTDGITWTSRTSSFTDNADTIRSVIWSADDSMWVAAADNGKLAYSDDGINWVQMANSLAATDASYSLAFGNGRYVVGGNGNVADSAFIDYSSGPWRLLDRRNSTTVLAQGLYWKRAKGEPASWTFTITSNKASSMVVAIQSAADEYPLAAQFSGNVGVSSTTVTAAATGSYDAHNGIAVMIGGTAIGTTWSADGTFAGSSPPDAQSASTGGSANTRTTTAAEHKSVTGSTTLASGTFVFAAAGVTVGHQIIVWEPLGKRPIKPKKPNSGLQSSGAGISTVQQAVNRSTSY